MDGNFLGGDCETLGLRLKLCLSKASISESGFTGNFDSSTGRVPGFVPVSFRAHLQGTRIASSTGGQVRQDIVGQQTPESQRRGHG